MTLSLLGLFLLPFYLKMVIDPKGTHKYYKDLRRNEGLQLVFAFLLLLLALMIFSQTGFNFEISWDALLTWIGAIVALKGVAFLMPNMVKERMKRVEEKHLPVLGFLGLVFVLFLVYVDTQLI